MMQSRQDIPRGLSQHFSRLEYLVRTHLWAQILVAMALGVGTGLALSPSGGALVSPAAAASAAAWLAVPGRLFLALIQMVVVPLVLTSIILGITAGGSAAFVRRIGSRIAPYFVATTAIAVTGGAVLATLMAPGRFIPGSATAATRIAQPVLEALPDQSLPDRIIALVPANPANAILQLAMLEVVVFAILVAVALSSIAPERARPILDLCASLQEVSMKVISWAMRLAPAAVFGLLAQVSIQVGLDALLGLSAYVGTVLLGLLLLLGFYLVLVAVLARRNPLHFARDIREVQMLAFSTSSSAAVMPLSMKAAQEKLGVPAPIAQVVIPLGATVNMDGTALYQVIAAVFLTQVYGIDLSTSQLILLVVTMVGASIGAPSTPGAGIVILATIVHGMGVPPEGIAMIIGVDRLLDMSRTAVNVSGDLTACVVLTRWLGRATS